MKNLISFVFAVVLMVGLAAQVNAEYNKDRDYYLGEIISVNREANQITIYDYIDMSKRTFDVETGVDKDLKPGVEVMVNVIKGTSTAKRVKLIIPRQLSI